MATSFPVRLVLLHDGESTAQLLAEAEIVTAKHPVFNFENSSDNQGTDCRRILILTVEKTIEL
jgi:hypothetical protein